jgi:hypothetical protein
MIKVTTKKKKVYHYKCPICDKEISSLSSAQLNYNVKLHEGKHEKERKN